jgi:hypothetical protein
MIRCIRLWTGDDGDLHFEEGVIDLPPGRTWRHPQRHRQRCQDIVPQKSRWCFRIARRAGSPIWHHIKRHARLPDPHGRALPAAPEKMVGHGSAAPDPTSPTVPFDLSVIAGSANPNHCRVSGRLLPMKSRFGQLPCTVELVIRHLARPANMTAPALRRRHPGHGAFRHQSRSNSAMTARMPKIIRPCGRVVSTAAPSPVRIFRPTPRPFKSAAITTRS